MNVWKKPKYQRRKEWEKSKRRNLGLRLFEKAREVEGLDSMAILLREESRKMYNNRRREVNKKQCYKTT